MLRKKLFLKVYLTVVASLALVALTMALMVHVGLKDFDEGWSGWRDRFATAMFPATDNEAALSTTVSRLADAFDADVAVYGPDGTLLAQAGTPIAYDPSARWWRRHRDFEHGSRLFTEDLPGGRRLVARMGMPYEDRNPLLYIALIAGAIGVAAWPIVRHLTRRLEDLRRGVEAWGAGSLVTRVPVSGNDEVAAVAKTFNRAADQIERLIASHRSLLANASHELRSPLARLRMAIDLYGDSPDEAARSEIVRNLNELDTLVEEILLASRLDHVRRLDHVEPVDLLALAAEEGAGHDVSVSGEPFTVEGDPRLLRRLVRNLIQNALRHGAPPVTAEVERKEGGARLRVCDGGPGLPDGEGERVFEAFYRPSGRSETSGGWGLGLALVRQIAERHGGTVRYERPVGGGACFVVELPRRQTDTA